MKEEEEEEEVSQQCHVIGIPIRSSSSAAAAASSFPVKSSFSRQVVLPGPPNHYYITTTYTNDNSDDTPPTTTATPTTDNPSQHPPKFAKRNRRIESLMDGMSKLGLKAENLANGIREHVRLGPKISATVKGKLSLGAKIIQVGGLKKVLKHNFSVREGEKLLKASQCYLSTTAGPIAGLLFISTDKIAFCSERSIKLSSPNPNGGGGSDSLRINYKVLIPLRKIKRAERSENVMKPSRKYIQVVTEDNFDFWFMGFVNYPKTFKYLQQALSHYQ